MNELHSKKSKGLFYICREVTDYFHRMGGAGRYDGYQDWHSIAFVTLVALKQHLKNAQSMDLEKFGSLLKIFEVTDICERPINKIDQLDLQTRDVINFLRDVDDYLSFGLVRDIQRDEEVHDRLKSYRDWSAFSWFVSHLLIPEIERD